jgi:protein-S-isoprenylcysteine O-methyltransferase Ste14
MSPIHEFLFLGLWLAYFAYWKLVSAKVKATERREPMRSRLLRLVVILSAFALLWLPRIPVPLISERFIPQGEVYLWIGFFMTAGGLLFSVWARRHLGRNWSQAVTLKVDHELITTGPYAIVRHPIYTGLLLGILGQALARGEWRGLLAFALVAAVLWAKLRLEEQWMRSHFGEPYQRYSRRVAALLPLVL